MEFYVVYIHPLLRELSTFSPLIPVIIGLYLFKKHKSLQFKLLLLFAVVSFLTEAVAFVTVILGTKNNLWIGHLYTLFSFGILASIYYSSFSKVSIKILIISAVAGFVMVSFYDAFVLGGITKVNSISKMVANALLITMAIGYFYKVSNEPKVIFLEQDPLFMLSCAVLIYFAGTSMSYALFNHALEVSWDAARICMALVFVLNILFCSTQAFILRKMATC